MKIEVGYGLSRDNANSSSADGLAQVWYRGKPTVFDVTVTSSLTPVTSVKLVWQLGQQHLQLNQGSMLPTMLSARCWGGHAFHLPLRHTAIGGKRLRVCLLPSLSACNQPINIAHN